ncbi:MAG: AAA family ATPase [Candidatus Pacearchaeota archaeon]|nr:AAA family ATPase [Candidatus Pacearchaeota archaeon]
MPYIKKLQLQGFKSFAKPTEILFNRGLNVIVGPNGSGKSNLADAICFVLGRRRMKSLRAERSANLIYHGGKEGKPSQFAKVNMLFDINDGVFVLPEPAKEVEITRIVKKDGTSIYKINGRTKTRQEILDLLAQAGIDPDGFNIILQAEINTIINMHPEEKRGIIEEIAGISVYETRKEKSLHELEKTEERLKEVRVTLNERAAYMRNLEKEKEQAEKYERLKRQIRKDKAALVFKKVKERGNESKKLGNRLEEKKEALARTHDKINAIQKRIIDLDKQVQEINEHIEKKSGFEQEKLFHEISEVRSASAVIDVKIENYKEQLKAINRRIEQLKIDEIRIGQEIKQLEQEKSRQKEQKLNAQDFKREVLKAAVKMKDESKKLEEIFLDLFEKVRQRRVRIDDLIRQNKIKDIHDEVNALVYYLEEIAPELNKASKKTAEIVEELGKLQIGEEDKRNINLEIELAHKEMARIAEIIKKSLQEKGDFEKLVKEMIAESEKKKKAILEKEKIEKKLRETFDKLLLKKSQLQGLIKQQEIMVKAEEARAREIENDINTINIMKARVDAEAEVALSEMREYEDLKEDLEKMSIGSIEEIETRIEKNERALREMGNVNLKALEVYDKIKADYQEIEMKVSKLEEEKQEILKIIEEVDKKKKQAFMQAFNAINEFFSANFAALSNKGYAFLELENKQDPFSGGLNIVLKLAKGKYMDAEELSGGEKVIVSLALIFAIQKYKPYCFYIFDEIDPALDKRNSEMLASILRKNVQNSQCIIITHNDAVINNADVLYGATMQEGISKILSLKFENSNNPKG